MNTSLSLGIIALLVPLVAQASVTVVWSPNDAAAAPTWLNGIINSESRPSPDSLYYFTTDSNGVLTDPIIANLTVWSDHAELNILGIGALPTRLSLWGSFVGNDRLLLEVPQDQLVIGEPQGGGGSYSFSSNFPVESSFARVVVNSEAADRLLLFADLGGPTEDVFTFRLATIPEPGVTAFGTLGAVLLLQRRRNKKGEQGVAPNA